MNYAIYVVHWPRALPTQRKTFAVTEPKRRPLQKRDCTRKRHMCAATVHRLADCIADRIRFTVPEPTNRCKHRTCGPYRDRVKPDKAFTKAGWWHFRCVDKVE